MRRLLKRFAISKKYQQWWKRNRWWIVIGFTVFIIAVIAFVRDDWHPRTGFQAKTLWEWLELLGVPLTLALLGLFFQWQEKKRVREETKEQRKVAADEAKDDILQAYFDRLSALLVDKNLLAIAAKLYPNNDENRNSQQDSNLSPEQKGQLEKVREVVKSQIISSEQQELFDAGMNIVRAKTLSILRRFEGDGERKVSVIEFLIDTELLSKAKLSLRRSDLRDVKLYYAANLEGANLKEANLEGSDLWEVNFKRANLCEANLKRTCFCAANLEEANLEEANLEGADLRGANLGGACLYMAELKVADLRGANLGGAFFFGADLRGANLEGANLEGADFQNIQWSVDTVWPSNNILAKARNIPGQLEWSLEETYMGL